MISNNPLMSRWENSICSAAELREGMIRPLQLGQEDPHPSPEPVALTIAPAIIDKTESPNPAPLSLYSVTISYLLSF